MTAAPSLGAWLDGLVADANLIGLTAERGPRLVSDLNDEDFPHCFVTGQVAYDRGAWNQAQVEFDGAAVIVTRGETENAAILRGEGLAGQVRGFHPGSLWTWPTQLVVSAQPGEREVFVAVEFNGLAWWGL